MSAIGDLVITLSARADNFTRTVRAARGDLDTLSGSAKRTGAEVAGFSARMQAIGGRLGGFKAAIGGAVAALTAGKVATVIRDRMSQIDDLSKAARRAGISAKDLVGLQHAAKLSGVEVDQLAVATKKLLTTISSANRGGEAADVLARLGLSPQMLQAMPVTEMMQAIATAINNIGDVATRTEIAVRLFGKSGDAMLSLFEQGASGLREAAAEAERLGLGISDIDAAGIEAANDALDKMKDRAGVAATTLATRLAPLLERVADAATWTMGGGAATPAIVSGPGKSLQQILEQITAAGANVMPGQLAAADALLPEALAKLQGRINPEKFNAIASAAYRAHDAIEALRSGTGDAAENMETLRQALNSVKDALGVTAAESAAQVKRIEDMVAQAQAKVREQFDAAQKQAIDYIAKKEQAQRDILGAAQEQIDTFGMDDAQRAAYDLQQAGGSPEEIYELMQLYDQIAAKKKEQAAIDEAMAIREDLKTPADLAMERIQRANELLSMGKLRPEERTAAVKQAVDALDPTDAIRQKIEGTQALFEAGKLKPEEYAAAMERFLGQAEDQTDRGEPGGVAALEKGSADAYSAIVSAMQKSQQERGLDAVEKNTADTAGLLGEIADIMREERDGGQPIPTA